MFRLLSLTLLICAELPAQGPQPGDTYLSFDGVSSYVEVPTSPDFSVTTTGSLTISAWMKPDVLDFPSTESDGYLHWLGKGSAGQQEWTFRLYNLDSARPNRVSLYVFSPAGGLGNGSYFQSPITPGPPLAAGQWVHIVGVIDPNRTYIYENGDLQHCDEYRGPGDGTCRPVVDPVDPGPGDAPLRMGTRDFNSYFQGGLSEVRIWNRALTDDEIANLYASDTVPPDGLVAEYLLNEGDGRTAYDTAGGHDGDIFGASWAVEGGDFTSPLRVLWRE